MIYNVNVQVFVYSKLLTVLKGRTYSIWKMANQDKEAAFQLWIAYQCRPSFFESQ